MELKKIGVRVLRQIIVVALCFTCIPSSLAVAADNAVGGVVRSKKDNHALGNVKVTLVQNASLTDQTRAEDGIYIILAPESRDHLDLLYEKDGYLSYSLRVG